MKSLFIGALISIFNVSQGNSSAAGAWPVTRKQLLSVADKPSILKQSPFSGVKQKLTFFAFWLIWSALHAVVVNGLGFRWETAALDATTMNSVLAVSCFLISNNLRYYMPQYQRYWYILFWTIGISVASVFAIKWLLARLLAVEPGYPSFLADSMMVRYCVALLMVGCMALISVLWFSIREQQEQEQRKMVTEQLARDAELFNLRQQLQPHFLFNSLNSINALIGIRPDEARVMIQKLADFLRGTLKKDDHQQVLLSDELNHLQLYLDIEKVRFGHRLKTEVVIEAGSEQLALPALLLQPILENAIKFGLYDTIEDICIHIHAEKSDGYLVVEVRNPFDRVTASSAGGTGFGLNSVKRRLILLFGRSDLLHTLVAGNQFITTLRIPQRS